MASTTLPDDTRLNATTSSGLAGALRGACRWVVRTGAWLPVVVIAAIASPLVLTGRTFGSDWPLHLWLLSRQQLNLQDVHVPGLFVSAESRTLIPMGVFFPVFAFTGATLYTIGALLSIALGNQPVAAYCVLWVGGFAIAYGGLSWIAHQVGLRGLRAQVPGALYVTGAYYLTNAYARGDLGELVGISALPLFVAAVCSMLASDRMRIRDALALVGTTVLLTGSHNITLLWGTVFLVALGIVGLAAFRPSPSRARTSPRLLPVIGLGILTTGVNAWSLAPNLAYGLDTFVAKESAANGLSNGGLATASYLLDPFRATSGGIGRDIAVTLPWMALLWAVAAVWVSWRSSPARWLQVMVVGSAVIGAGFLLLATTTGVWRALPTVFENTQFTWRLHSYVLLAAVLVVMFALRMVDGVTSDGMRRALHLALAGIVAFNVAIAVVQIWRVPSRMIVPGFNVPYQGDRADLVTPRGELPVSYYGSNFARDLAPRVVAADPDRTLRVPPEDVFGSTYRGVVDAPEGFAPFHTNIATGEHLIDVDGIDVLGRDADGFLVARRSRAQGPTGPVELTITAASPAPVVIGRVVSVLSLLGLALVFLVLAIRWWRRRGRASSPPAPSAPREASTAASTRTSPRTPRR